MDTPIRILRADAEEFDTDPPRLSKRRQAERDRIFRVLPAIIARRGLEGLTVGKLALALDISTSSLRRHIVDLDFFLFKVLRTHLNAILAALHAIPAGAPDRVPQCRAAWRALTLNAGGNPLPAQLLLERHRDALPDDLLDIIDALRDTVHAMLGADPCNADRPETARPAPAESPSRQATGREILLARAAAVLQASPETLAPTAKYHSGMSTQG